MKTPFNLKDKLTFRGRKGRVEQSDEASKIDPIMEARDADDARDEEGSENIPYQEEVVENLEGKKEETKNNDNKNETREEVSGMDEGKRESGEDNADKAGSANVYAEKADDQDSVMTETADDDCPVDKALSTVKEEINEDEDMDVKDGLAASRGDADSEDKDEKESLESTVGDLTLETNQSPHAENAKLCMTPVATSAFCGIRSCFS